MPSQLRSNPHAPYKAFEGKLWSKIRNNQSGVSFCKQHVISNYIVDFSPKENGVRATKKVNH
jgi:very-short-patch-repair endonuclease